MDDEQRKAMFARMHGGGGGGRSSGARYSSDSGAVLREPNLSDKIRRVVDAVSRIGDVGVSESDPAWKRGLGLAAALALPLPGGKVRAANVAKRIFTAKPIRDLLVSAVAGFTADKLNDYRTANPDMPYKSDRNLALAAGTAESIAAIYGLKSAKGIVGKGLAKLTKAIPLLEKAASALKVGVVFPIDNALKSLAAKTPGFIKTPLSLLKRAYDAVVDWTGTEIPAIGDALKNPKSIKALAKAVGLVGAATGLETYRRGKIDDAAADMKKAFEEGRAWELPGDKNFLDSTGAQIGFSVLSSLGNPVEKTISDFVSGKYSKNVADEARYMVEQDKINEMEKQGRLRPDEASKMRKDLAAKSKPLNMAGPVPRVFTPAAGNAVKWIVGDAIKDAKTPSVYRTVKPSDERDGDTVSTTAGTSIRFKGIDATEIAHAAKMGSTDEPYGREGAERMKELVPDGSTIRLRSDPNNPTDTKDKYGREIGYVERLRGPQIIGKAIATVPGLRDVWPAEDVQQTMIEEGLARAAYENLDPVQHSRAMDYHAAQADAIRAGVKLAGPEGEKLRTQPDQRTGQKKSWWLPKDAVTNPDGTVTLSAERPNLPVWAGAGLMYTGQSGVPGKLGTLGKAIMTSWNAGLAGWGTAVSRQAGPKNTGREYRVPAAFAEDKKRKQWQAELPYWKP